MKIFAVTVTYGNRFNLLKQVIDSVLQEGVTKIIVVDNNSQEESKNKLKIYEQKLNGKVKVLYLDENYGSSGGFKRGLVEAYNDPECEFIWLLDDDNMPLKGSLDALMFCWNNIDCPDKNKKVALLSWRISKEFLPIESIIKKNPDLVLGKKNSFLGFHIFQLPVKLVRLTKRVLMKRQINLAKHLRYLEKNNIIYGEVSAAPYGGLFIHKKIIETIGYPDEKFFTYADDHEWTYRITKAKGKIFFCWESHIKDLEMSWHIKNNRLSMLATLLKSGSHLQIYYSVRNRVYFEYKDLITNRLIYNLNKFTYLFFLNIVALIIGNKKRLEIIKKAVRDGSKFNLGNNF